MMLRPLTIAAAGLSAASAFLLPPEIRTGFAHSHHDVALLEEPSQSLLLDCPGCPVPIQEDESKIRLASGMKSHLELNFKIDHSRKHPRLVVNDFEIFPHPDPMHNALVAKHVPDSSEDGSALPPVEEAVSVTLGASLGWQRKKTNKKTPMSLIIVDLQIIEILSGFVDGIPNIQIGLVHCPHTGRLRIADIRQTESQAKKHVPLAKQLTECGESMMCKVRAFMLDKVRKMKSHMSMGHKGCAKHHGMGGHHGHHMGGMGGHHGGHGLPMPHGTVASKPHFKLREHSWSQLWNKFAHHILFPIGVGIVAGVSVSLVGMVIGTLLVGLWRVFIRGQSFFPRRRTHRRSKSNSVSEKAALMANVEEPPVYKDEEPKETEAN